MFQAKIRSTMNVRFSSDTDVVEIADAHNYGHERVLMVIALYFIFKYISIIFAASSSFCDI